MSGLPSRTFVLPPFAPRLQTHAPRADKVTSPATPQYEFARAWHTWRTLLAFESVPNNLKRPHDLRANRKPQYQNHRPHQTLYAQHELALTCDDAQQSRLHH